MAADVLAVGNGAGFWGDAIDAPVDLAASGKLDVLTLEYLAELTMAILAHLRSKDPRAGFVTDLPPLVARLATHLREQTGLKVVTNGGGLNPPACAAACGRELAAAGLGDLPIAVVTGDDVLPLLRNWAADGLALDHFETGEPIAGVLDRLVSANVYLGARPIAEAVIGGARLVLTGRVADASLTLGPAIARFGWPWDDWSRLAGASTAGHLIECGAQATGGLWQGWADLPDVAGIGYPIAEIAADGTCTITKPPGTGGAVTVATVAEQLVYEIDDPTRYRTPDVDVDFTGVELAQDGADRVRVTGARGVAPTERLKLSAVYRDGWTASGMLALAGRGAERRARAAGATVLERLRRAGAAPVDALVECLGAGDLAPGLLRPAIEPMEVVLRVSVRDPSREVVARFCKELAPLVTGGPPGVAGYATGRPEPRPAFGYWPALVPRELAEARTRVETRTAAEWAATG